MRVLPQKLFCLACPPSSGCCRKLSHGLHPSSAPNLEDTQQVSPCDCPTPPDSTLSKPSNGHVKPAAFQPPSPTRLGNETPAKGSAVDADDEVESSSSSIDDGSPVADARVDNACDGAEEKEIGEGSPDGFRALKSILKKKLRKSPSSSGPNLENKRVRWLPNEELAQVREFDQCPNQDEDDENSTCGCIIL